MASRGSSDALFREAASGNSHRNITNTDTKSNTRNSISNSNKIKTNGNNVNETKKKVNGTKLNDNKSGTIGVEVDVNVNPESPSNTIVAINTSSNINTSEDDPTVFLCKLSNPLQEYAMKALGPNAMTTMAQCNSKNSNNGSKAINRPAIQRMDELEISARTQLLTITSSLLDSSIANDEAVTEESMEELLKFMRAVIDLCQHILHYSALAKLAVDKDGNANSNTDSNDSSMLGDGSATLTASPYESYLGMDSVQMRKLPFLLLEDTVDTLPIPIIQVFWKYGPSQWLQPLLCCPTHASTNTTNTNNPATSTQTSNKTTIGAGPLFPLGSKYILIRLCNRLLCNLSVQSHDEAAQFAGQISITLASVFPLSERSAVNVLGAFHVDSVVEFESLEKWLSQRRQLTDGAGGGGGAGENGAGESGAGDEVGGAGDADGTIGDNTPKQQKQRQKTQQKTASVVPLEYEFYSTFWNVQQSFTDPQKLLPPKMGPAATAAAAKNSTATGTSAAGAGGCGGWSEKMEEFLKEMVQIFGAFEGHPFGKDVVKHLNASWASKKKDSLRNKHKAGKYRRHDSASSSLVRQSDVHDTAMDIDMDSCHDTKATAAATSVQTKHNTVTSTITAPSPSINRHYKYLTNSQLLNLQLQDPEIRIHFLTQFLIISSYLSLSVSAHAAANATPSLPVPLPNASPTRKRNNAATTATNINTTDKLSSTCKSIVDQLTHLDKRANMLLRQTPPNGEVHAKTLHWILSERESIWRQWKKAKCTPSIERFAVAATPAAVVKAGDTTVAESAKSEILLSGNGKGKKRTASAMVDGSQPEGSRDGKRGRHQGNPSSSTSAPNNKNTMQSKSKFYSFKIDIRKDLPTLSRNITKRHTPNLHAYLEEYVEALDPEAGIEKEYHPKNDKLFAWRALRLLARDHAGDFGRCTVEGLGKGTMIQREDGDFEGMVRSIWKEERGIDIPGEMPTAEVISDDEGEEEENKEEAKEDGEEDTDSKVGVDGKDVVVEIKDTIMSSLETVNQSKTEDLSTASVTSNVESDDLFPQSPAPFEHFGPQELPQSEISAEAATKVEQTSSTPNTAPTTTEGKIKATKQPRDPQHAPSTMRSKQNTVESKGKDEKRGSMRPKQGTSPNKVKTSKHHSGESAISTRRGSESTRNPKKEDTKKEQVRDDVDGAAPRTSAPSETSRAKAHGDGKKELSKENGKQTENISSPSTHESIGKEKESPQKESAIQVKDNQDNASLKKKEDNVHKDIGGSRQNNSSRSPLEGSKRTDRGDSIVHGRHSLSDAQSRPHREQRPQQHGRPLPPRRGPNGPLREPMREPLMRDGRNPGWRPNQDMNGGQQHMGNGHGRDHGGPRGVRPFEFERNRGGNTRNNHGRGAPTRRDR